MDEVEGKVDIDSVMTRLRCSEKDPMWADHSEISKRTLRDALHLIATLQSAIAEKDAEIRRLRHELYEAKGLIEEYQNHSEPYWEARAEAAEATAARLQAERDGDVAKAVAAEREACAQIAYDTMAAWGDYGWKCQADGLQEAIGRPALTGESDG